LKIGKWRLEIYRARRPWTIFQFSIFNFQFPSGGRCAITVENALVVAREAVRVECLAEGKSPSAPPVEPFSNLHFPIFNFQFPPGAAARAPSKTPTSKRSDRTALPT
jgi:hypothetical protein